MTASAGGAFVGWYLLVYAVGVAVVQAIHQLWDPSSLVTALVTVGITAPLNFLGGRLLFRPAPRDGSVEGRAGVPAPAQAVARI
jgi:hypothetical protein